MSNRRKFLRFETRDFLEIKPLNEVAKYTKASSFNISLMGICFSSEVKWEVGQVILIDYFVPDEMESVKIKTVISWSEYIDEKTGFLAGAQIINIEEEKENLFINYYFQKLKKKFF